MRELTYFVVVLALALASAYVLALADARLAPACLAAAGKYGVVER